MVPEVVSKDNWKRFISEGSFLDENMSYELIDSWKRCKNHGVDPFDGVSQSILKVSDLRRRLQHNQLLIKLTEEQLDHLNYFLKGWRFVTTLTDKDGFILQNIGDHCVEEKAREIHFIQGSNWGEIEVGTNAIGLAHRFKKPFTVKGYAHFAVASQIWNCAAAPIVDQDNHILGVLNISSPYNPINYSYVLATVKMIADSISLAWRKTLYEDMEYLEKNATSIHTIICSRDNIICKLPKFLKKTYGYLLGESLDMLQQEVGLKEEKIPIKAHGRIIGYQIYVEEPKQEKQATIYFRGVTGKSQAFQKVLDHISKVASTDVAVHIYGETGTGKELIAEAVHRNSDRNDSPFISINCGAVPEQLLESELFGYEPGSFTGAHKLGKVGKLEAADGGTLFLDEIGDMPNSMQVSLLRVLQQNQVTRIGGHQPIDVDVRVISAANVDIRDLVQAGKMRDDLFYRIYGYPIHVPTLRQRNEDIPFFIHDFCRKKNWHPSWVSRLIAIFKEGMWLGNIRELYNALDRCRISFTDREPSEEELYTIISLWSSKKEEKTAKQKLNLSFREQLEYEKIQNALITHHNHVERAAKELNISRSTLYRKLKKYNLT